MANPLGVVRLNKYFGGGITATDTDKAPGVAVSVEELDVFQSEEILQPTTIFVADSVIARKVTGYAPDSSENLFAISRDTTGTPLTQIFKKTTAGADSPGAWASFFTSTGVSNAYSPIGTQKLADGSAEYALYVTGTTALVKLNLSTVAETSVGALDGVLSGWPRTPFLKAFGRTYVGHGRYIALFDTDGTFTQHKFTLTNEWCIVSMAVDGNYIAILAKNVASGTNECRVFYWDTANATGAIDIKNIPSGGPQVIVNFRGKIWVLCAIDGILIAYHLTYYGPQEVLRLYNISTETSTQPVIPDATKFVKNNVLYFGLWKTDKSGLYAIGSSDEAKPIGIILQKRFATTDYSLHKPTAAISYGPNFFVSYLDNGTDTNMKLENNNSPTRSSAALWETVWIDAGSPETLKDWVAVCAMTQPMPASCSITSIMKTDNAAAYDSSSSFTFSNANDQVLAGVTADTYFYRTLTSVVGRILRHKITFTSSGTSKPVLYGFSYIYRPHNLM